MDRPVDPHFRRQQILRRAAFSVGGLALVLALFGWGPGLLTPTLSRSRIRTALVDSGPLEATISASGTVLPELEQVLSSPVDARVLRVLKQPGALLSKGDPILELDISQSVLGLDRVQEQLSLRANQQAQKRLDLENTLISLRSQIKVKALDLKSYQLQAIQRQKLFAEGLTSESDLRNAEVLEEKARTELTQLEESIDNAHSTTEAQIQGLALEINTLQKEKAESQRQLDLATAQADRSGVLTWVMPEAGVTVRKGDVMARIADLGSFKVEATISDVHANRLTAGMPVRIRVNEQSWLDGRIVMVLPAIKDGVVTLAVQLEDKTNKLLRSNLRVDVFIVTEAKPKVLRIKRGPFVAGEGAHEVFVIRNDLAVRTSVRIGIASFENYEVLNGLFEGDEVIISEMTDYVHLKEVNIR